MSAGNTGFSERRSAELVDLPEHPGEVIIIAVSYFHGGLRHRYPFRDQRHGFPAAELLDIA